MLTGLLERGMSAGHRRATGAPARFSTDLGNPGTGPRGRSPGIRGFRLLPKSARSPSQRHKVRGLREGERPAVQRDPGSLHERDGRTVSTTVGSGGGCRHAAWRPGTWRQGGVIEVRPTPAPSKNLERFSSACPLPPSEHLKRRTCFKTMSPRLARFVKRDEKIPPEFPGGSGSLRIPRLAGTTVRGSAVQHGRPGHGLGQR